MRRAFPLAKPGSLAVVRRRTAPFSGIEVRVETSERYSKVSPLGSSRGRRSTVRVALTSVAAEAASPRGILSRSAVMVIGTSRGMVICPVEPS